MYIMPKILSSISAVLLVVLLLVTHTLQVHADFNFVRMWGEPGPNLFNGPASAIDIDSEGNIYIVAESGNKVQKFDDEGTLLLEWNTIDEGTLSQTTGLTIDNQDQVYVVDSNGINKVVYIYNTQGEYVRTIDATGAPVPDTPYFCSPYGITTDSQRNVYIGDGCLDGRVYVFDDEGEYVTYWQIYDDAPGSNPIFRSLAVDSDDNVYIVDTSNQKLFKYDNNGTLVGELGEVGVGEGQFNTPQNIAIDAMDNLYLSDSSTYRVQKYSTSGTFIDQIALPNGIGEDEFINPSALAVDNQGHLYIHDTIRMKVYLDTDAAPATPTPTPTDTPTVTPTGTVSPTNTPAPTGSQDSTTHKKTSVKSKSPRPPMCRDLAPTSSPDLYQIDVTDTTATLYFAPVTGSVSYYAVSYGYWSGDERFGTSFAQGHSDGAITYTINHLEPGATYHFKVRGGNGCMPGEWGNEIKITTNKSSVPNKKPYYKNLVTKVLNSF